ncbi:MAG: ParB N-terminal domain-containing protein [Rhodobacter sp.]|nr:ParB N-terminal domain-containing protein [Rhodobacter sp.]
MAKRKRLSPAQTDYLQAVPAELETKSAGLSALPGRAPVAQVAGEASAAAALEDLAGEVRRARDEGRMIQAIPLDRIEAGYLVRDRMLADEEDLQALACSILARGQQTPIEVVALGEDRYGLLSGWRRLTVFQRLADSGEARFAAIQAILRQPETAADAYLAMVEENEIRVGLSYYERARIAAKAVEQGAFAHEKQALLSLFTTASRAKRSKIRAFLEIYRAADDLLRFPMAISERLGLALAKALEPSFACRASLRQALEHTSRKTAAEEIAVLETALTTWRSEQSLEAGLETETRPAPSTAVAPAPAPVPDPGAGPLSGFERPAKGIDMAYGGRTVTLTGPGVTDAFRARLLDWLKTQV